MRKREGKPTKIIKKKKNETNKNLELAYGVGGSYKLIKDDQKTNISPACKAKLD